MKSISKLGILGSIVCGLSCGIQPSFAQIKGMGDKKASECLTELNQFLDYSGSKARTQLDDHWDWLWAKKSAGYGKNSATNNVERQDIQDKFYAVYEKILKEVKVDPKLKGYGEKKSLEKCLKEFEKNLENYHKSEDKACKPTDDKNTRNLICFLMHVFRSSTTDANSALKILTQGSKWLNPDERSVSGRTQKDLNNSNNTSDEDSSPRAEGAQKKGGAGSGK